MIILAGFIKVYTTERISLLGAFGNKACLFLNVIACIVHTKRAKRASGASDFNVKSMQRRVYARLEVLRHEAFSAARFASFARPVLLKSFIT